MIKDVFNTDRQQKNLNFDIWMHNLTRAVGGRRNPSAYVVNGTQLPFDFYLERTSKSPFCRVLP